MTKTREALSQKPNNRPDRKAARRVLLSWDGAVRMVGDRFFMWDMAKLWGISSGFRDGWRSGSARGDANDVKDHSAVCPRMTRPLIPDGWSSHQTLWATFVSKSKGE